MSIIKPEFEIVDRSEESIRFLEHGWPTDLCRWHAHEEYELHLILETSGTSFVGDFIGDFKAGSLYLTGPQLPHNWITEQASSEIVPIRDMLVQFHDNAIQSAINSFPELIPLRQMLGMAASGIEFDKFPLKKSRENLEKIRDSSGVDRFVHFTKFLGELNEWPHKKLLSVTRMNMSMSEANQGKINTIVDFVLNNYREDIGLQDAADIAHMSPSAFSRYFSRSTGNRFSDFVTQVRLGRACKLLYETDNQISSICFACGFNSLANFNRQFLKVKGTTPREYRRVARDGLHNIAAE